MKNEENRFIVKSTPAAGFQGKWRAGRRWDKSGIEIEVVDQDKDPPAGDDACLRIGKETFRALQEDEFISVSPKGLNLSNMKAMEQSLAELTTAHGELQARHAALETEHESAQEQLRESEDLLTRAQAEIVKVQAEVADLRETVATLAEASKAEPKAEAPKAEAKPAKAGK